MKTSKILIVAFFVMVLCVAGGSVSFAQEPAVKKEFAPISLDDAAVPEYDYSRANKLPMTGYLEKSFDVNSETRTVKIYIAATAPIRTFFTVIAVPDGVDTTEFLVKSGWHDIADAAEEGLVLLEPGSNGWGKAEDEQAYINAAIDFYKRNDYFSIFGIHYFVGYGSGGMALEAWAAANPLMVISQVYVDTESLSDAYYAQFVTKYFDGKSSGYTPIEIPEEIKFAYNEVPVPTWYINSDLTKVATALSYWKGMNDCVSESISSPDYLYGSDIYAQAKDSDAWATAYTGPISKVATLERHIDILDVRFSNTIYDFLTEYVSYDNTTAYGNHLSPRAEYGEIGTILVNGQIREFQIYVPDSAAELWPNGAPVIFVFAGNTQTDKVFFHNTLWWKVADEEGVILAIPCETYSRTSTSVSHADTGMFYEKLAEYLITYYNVDPTRFYATGQSAGSFASQGFGITNPEYFAAIASTSGLSHPDDGQSSGPGRVPPEDVTNEMIPTYCMIGEGDIEFMIGTLWDDTENMLDKWAAYYLEANGVGPLGDGSNVEVDGRYTTWTWKNKQGFPLFKVTRTAHRAHNCIPAEMPILWDYMKHWSYKDGIRYYDETPVMK